MLHPVLLVFSVSISSLISLLVSTCPGLHGGGVCVSVYGGGGSIKAGSLFSSLSSHTAAAVSLRCLYILFIYLFIFSTTKVIH